MKYIMWFGGDIRGLYKNDKSVEYGDGLSVGIRER